MMVGLPRSGKSTRSKELGYPIVEMDAIRKALGQFPFDSFLDTLVWSTSKLMILSLFYAGHTDVILDATNVTKSLRSKWENGMWGVKYHIIDTPKEVCIERAIKTSQEYLVPVIERMSKRWEEDIANQEG
jgi:tRNA uridine 5-carbamoylmethylation protein Kti12